LRVTTSDNRRLTLDTRHRPSIRHLPFTIHQLETALSTRRSSSRRRRKQLNGMDARRWYLVDVVDLDGDGTAQVIAQGFEIENILDVIYKRQVGTWRPVYKGGGGGAC
jgi:hypothetical protein